MSGTSEIREWWTAAEFVDLGLPGLAQTERGLQLAIERVGGNDPDREYTSDNHLGIWRKRQGRGGGREYRIDVLPTEARAALALRLRKAAQPAAKRERTETSSELWEWFERLPDSRKAEARRRLEALQAVHDLEMAGRPKDLAMMEIATRVGASLRTLYNWANMVAGVPRADWLPHLMPHYASAPKKADCTPEAWEMYKGNYLRQEGLSHAHAYRQLKAAAKEHGWTIPSRKTLERRIAELDETTRIFLRKGPEALKRLYPAQERDRTALHALEAVNADGHKWDVFVQFPDGEVTRPCLVGFQDLYSGMILSWRVDKSENKAAVRLAFGDMVETYGIPDHVVFDNGRNFASKWITGGAPTRYRFKVKDDEPAGVVTEMGCTLHWATPFHGQAKPIERAWRDFAQNIARDVRFEGAWTGNTIANKPENYGSKAVPLETFLGVVAEGIAEHNARTGRRSKVCAGRSFSEAFRASYQDAPIRQASPAQQRKWLLPAEAVTARKPDGAVHLAGNRYWAEFLVNHIGQKLVLRVDPQAMHQDAHIYRLDGSYLGAAQCVETTGFFDADAARNHARARNDFLNAAKAMARAERQLSAAEVATLLSKVDEPAPLPEPTVVRPVFGSTGGAARQVEYVHDQDAFLADFSRATLHLVPTGKENGAED
ncbi:transposase domain-containing protein [Pararhodobacter sp.]|uniref:transposase domain-containing protein n=1 Tax=Pararhodobacter sp. TaxID=2127056 RepID=UPI002AFDE3E7|nr:transposase domain-containing protein [Pararhodobacter sp.]